MKKSQLIQLINEVIKENEYPVSDSEKRAAQHIYLNNPGTGCKTTEDWVNLAIMALDQAGLLAGNQHKVRQVVNSFPEISGKI